MHKMKQEEIKEWLWKLCREAVTGDIIIALYELRNRLFKKDPSIKERRESLEKTIRDARALVLKSDRELRDLQSVCEHDETKLVPFMDFKANKCVSCDKFVFEVKDDWLQNNP